MNHHLTLHASYTEDSIMRGEAYSMAFRQLPHKLSDPLCLLAFFTVSGHLKMFTAKTTKLSVLGFA